MKKIARIGLFLILILIFTGVWSGCEQKVEVNKLDRSQINIFSKGDIVETGDISWTLVESEYLGSLIVNNENLGSLETKVGRFLSLSFKVVNNSQEPRSIYDLKVIDSHGNQFSVCIEAYGYYGAEEACVLVELLPGIERTLIATYDVPLDSVDLVLEVTDLEYPSKNLAYIDLGL